MQTRAYFTTWTGDFKFEAETWPRSRRMARIGMPKEGMDAEGWLKRKVEGGLGAEQQPTRTISRPLGALAFDAAFHIEEADTRSYITGTTFY
jgi:hypothetical protein